MDWLIGFSWYSIGCLAEFYSCYDEGDCVSGRVGNKARGDEARGDKGRVGIFNTGVLRIRC